MKKIAVAALTIAAVVAAGSPAFGDNNGKGQGNEGKGKPVKTVTYEINGTIKAIVDSSTVSVTVKNVNRPDGGKDVAAALVTAGVVNLTTDSKTAIRRGNTTTFASLKVGDKVAVAATCTLAPLACKATRINAAPAVTPSPSPSPSPQHLGFTLTGVIVGSQNNGETLTLVVVKADDGDDNPLNTKALIGLPYSVHTDSSTAVVKNGQPVPGGIPSLTTGNPAVTVSGTCTSAAPILCTATRITVIVPTP